MDGICTVGIVLWLGAASAERPATKGRKTTKALVVPARPGTATTRNARATRTARTTRNTRWVVNRPTRPAVRVTSPVTVRTTARVVHPVRRIPVVTVHRTSVPLVRSTDHRFARPHPFRVRAHPIHLAPVHRWYRPHWTRWWVHPHWRFTHATTVVVGLGFRVDPWGMAWRPPTRRGWAWVPGHQAAWGWIPGHWAPAAAAPTLYGNRWAYVPGWWMGTVYIEGFWRAADRPGWTWMEGYYLDNGTYVRGWWAPAERPPRAGYVWEGGFWDGSHWVAGFWRPRRRSGFHWVDGWLDVDGVYRCGFWEPDEDRPGRFWIPGWFDGTVWIDGYWVAEEVYNAEDAEHWEPAPGWDDHGQGTAPEPLPDEAPLALPVTIPEE